MRTSNRATRARKGVKSEPADQVVLTPTGRLNATDPGPGEGTWHQNLPQIFVTTADTSWDLC